MPSKVLDTTQTVTQKVTGTVSRAVSPSKSLQRTVDATGGAVSTVLGSASRILGKPVEEPQKVSRTSPVKSNWKLTFPNAVLLKI